MGNRRLVRKGLVAVAGAWLILGAPAHGQSAATTTAKPPASAPAPIPSADQILNRYVEATGGRAAWQKLTSRVSRGTIDAPSMNMSGTIEVYEKAPNRVLVVVVMAGAQFRQGFDGAAGWSDDPQNGLREQAGPELAETRRDADFYRPLNLRGLYTKFTVRGREKIRDRDAYLIEASLPEGGEPDKLYFDAQTGLPLRLISRRHGPEGNTEFQEDFEDYREVDGVQLPFTIHQSGGAALVTIHISEARHNLPIDDSQFARPAVQ